MKTSLTLASIMMLIIGVHLTIPKIIQTAVALNTVPPNGHELSVEDRFNDKASEVRISKSSTQKIVANEIGYEPPNYGGPDSQYGSGTR